MNPPLTFEEREGCLEVIDQAREFMGLPVPQRAPLTLTGIAVQLESEVAFAQSAFAKATADGDKASRACFFDRRQVAEFARKLICDYIAQEIEKEAA